jgi:diguanylate cyclase (GGDEF)-like protein
MGDVAPEPHVSARVLFVDDDVVTRRAFARALRSQGFIVDLAGDGREALALASEYPYALVATDHEMPGITGKELIQRLRDLQPDSKFAVVTGLLDAVEECRGLPEVSAILVKPWRSGELLDLVKRAVDEAGRRAERQKKHVAPVPSRRGELVLLVEDSDVDAAILTRGLESAAPGAYRVVRARSLAEGLAQLKQRKFTVVLTDLGLPDSEGIAAVSELGAASPGTPILAVTGSNDETQALEAVQDGAQDYLLKGRFDGDGVLRAIRYAIERKRVEKHLSELAHFDQLTRLANRTLLNERLGRALVRTKRSGKRVALLSIDLDHFKVVNDTHGHSFGDQLLVEVARRLVGSTRAEDTVARVGGDEFAILLEDIDEPDGARRVAQRILNSIATPLIVEGRELPVTLSIGVALFPDHAANQEELYRSADRALYQAKDFGKNTFAIVGQHGRDRISRRLEIERDVLGAVDTERFSLSLQPLCDVADGRVRGHEAFLRFQAPDGSEVTAQEFVSILDESGEILRVGRWVIHRACELAARGYPKRGKISVNVSLRELVAPDFVAMVRETLRTHELSGSALELELSEASLTKGITDAREKLPELAALGLGIVLDDFGTGRSSLSELAELPITKVKLSPRLIRNLSQERGRATVGAIIAAARCLGWSVVAKSVETRDQLEILRSLGCPRAQGLLFGAPRPALI